MSLLKKIKIVYIHFIRKPLFIFSVKANFIRKKKLKPYYFLASNNYCSDNFKVELTNLEDESKIISDAELVIKNKFQTLGSDILDLGEKINWHCDYKSGRVWNKVFYTKINPAHSINKSDIKFPWELSRFHQSLWLAKAYIITLNEKYSKKFFELVESWIDENPFCYGVNWNCAMEVAIRSVNWILALHIFSNSKSLDNRLLERIYHSLYQHGIFIRNNLEYGRRNGNHYLSDLMGLVWLGAFFKNHRFGKKWLKFAKKELEKEIRLQVYSDGVDYEKSTYYQRLVAEILLLSIIALKNVGMNLSFDFENRLHAMFNFISSYVMEDGVPNVGDCDDGKVLKSSFDEKISDMRNFISLGAVFFSDKKLKTISKKCDSMILFLFGEEGISKFNLLADVTYEKKSIVFPEGGFIILQSEKFKLFFDAGDIGMNGWGGHGHNDILSFELSFNGKRFIVDSGTYVYTPEPEIRQKLRSTCSHNTIMVDNVEIADFLNLFRIKEDLTKPVLNVTSLNQANYDEVECEHFAYSRLNYPVRVKRKIAINKTEEKILIQDEIKGSGEHRIDLFIHFHPEVNVELFEKNKFKLERNGLSLIIEFNCDPNSSINLEDYIYSESYGRLTNNKRVHLSLKKSISTEIIRTYIYPL